MIVKANLIKPSSKLEPLIHENNELISIFVTSVKTAKQKEDKKLRNSQFLVRYSLFIARIKLIRNVDLSLIGVKPQRGERAFCFS